MPNGTACVSEIRAEPERMLSNDHHTLAQLRPGQTSFSPHRYQSLLHVAFVQHTCTLQWHEVLFAIDANPNVARERLALSAALIDWIC
jgi:hypothetical protein